MDSNSRPQYQFALQLLELAGGSVPALRFQLLGRLRRRTPRADLLLQVLHPRLQAHNDAILVPDIICQTHHESFELRTLRVVMQELVVRLLERGHALRGETAFVDPGVRSRLWIMWQRLDRRRSQERGRLMRSGTVIVHGVRRR